MRRRIARLVVVLAAVSGSVAALPAAASTPTAAAALKCQHSADSTCQIKSVTATSLTVKSTATDDYAHCTTNPEANCLAYYHVSVESSGFGNPASDTGSCSVADGAFSGGGGFLTANPTGSSVTCTVTWTWASTDYPEDFQFTLEEFDTSKTFDPGATHGFGVTRIPPAPRAAFATKRGMAPGEFVFTSHSTSAVGGLQESWQLNGVATTTGPVWDETFAKPGKYTVTLVVTDYSTKSSQVTHLVAFSRLSKSGTAIVITTSLSPSSDTGRFDLDVDGKRALASGSDGDLVVVGVKPGKHQVAEAAVTTPLTDYGVTLACHQAGGAGLRAKAFAASVTVPKGREVDCTFRDLRTAVAHCDVPILPGLSRHAAGVALTAAHCRLGKVSKPAGKSAKHLVVRSSSPVAGSVRKANAKVAVVLAA